ncbi:hypothetical protein P3T76_012670 [Phytophthora citrophthora]|uniref:Uncharacterized protein n=1 Tax=Phytophthora citrophthora TaxID=4793 RepID=A0AAD9G537_9STRA|nr:hypothetical protein P3T76_012670 [Phytophthora citrophthora]
MLANAWRQCPGVEYVLSIRISPGLQTREYRLDSIVNGQFVDPAMNHTPIINTTVVTLDPRRLLGIPPDVNLPAGFNNPVEFNLFDVVDPILQCELENIDLEQASVHAAAANDGEEEEQEEQEERGEEEGNDGGQPPRRRQRRH